MTPGMDPPFSVGFLAPLFVFAWSRLVKERSSNETFCCFFIW
jgi:hypothetical protein